MSDNNTEKVPPARKTYIFLALLLILVVLPAGSWFYLRGGLQWRKQAQSEIAHSYGKVVPATVIFPDGSKENEVAGKVCVVYFFGENPDLTPEHRKVLDTGEELFNQFGYKAGSGRNDFRMVMVSSGGTAEFKTHAQTLPSADMSNWVWSGALNGWKTTLQNGYQRYCLEEKIEPVPFYYALSDTSGTIRRFYNAQDDAQIGRMVEHIALLMPK
jgi:hypothetical protein